MRDLKLLVLTLLSIAVTSLSAEQQPQFEKFKGVWANRNTEVVITDSVMMFFSRNDSAKTGFATLCVPSRGISITTTFRPDTIIFSETPKPDMALRPDGKLSINGEYLQKTETLRATEPYDMPQACSNDSIGERLQEWQLGTNISKDGDNIMVTVGTNKNSFMYCIYNGMIYLRAAALLQCDKGSLFIQNIRMMKNQNTKEFTNYHFTDNLDFLTNLPPIDVSMFRSDRCIFGENSQIYWSYISHTPDKIQINGCGETYIIERQTKQKSELSEWFEFNAEKQRLVNNTPTLPQKRK